MSPRRHLAVTTVAIILLAACGGGTDTNGNGTGAAGSADQRPAGAQPSTREVELTSDRLDAYERGLKSEIAAVRAAQERSGTAPTPQERGEAIQASFEHATIPQGAKAAGLPVEEYRDVRRTINDIFQTLDFQGKIDGPLSMDLSRANEATKQRLSGDAFADLSPESAAALRARMDRLVPVWIEYVRLTAVAG